MRVCACVCPMYVGACVRMVGQSRHLCLPPSSRVMQGLSVNPEKEDAASLTNQLTLGPHLHLQSTKITGGSPHPPDFYVNTRYLKSSLHARWANILSTETFPQPGRGFQGGGGYTETQSFQTTKKIKTSNSSIPIAYNYQNTTSPIFDYSRSMANVKHICYYCCVCTCMCKDAHAIACVWKSREAVESVPSFHCGFWELNSGHQACKASTFTH